MGMTNVKVGLSFILIDVSGKKITWNTFVNGVSKMDTLEDVFRKQDEIVTVQNTKIMPYLKVDGSLITQVILVSSQDDLIQLSSIQALEHDMGSLVELNDSNVVKLEVHVKLPSTNSSQQDEKVEQTASSSRSTNAMKLLMENQKKAHEIRSKYERNRLPQPKAKDNNGRSRLWNALLEFCVENKVQFLECIDGVDRKKAFDSVVSILWKLNLVEIKTQDWKKRPPKELDQFLGFSFYDTSANKGKRKRQDLDEETLNSILQMLTGVLASANFTRESVKMHTLLHGLLESIGCQIKDCLHESQRKSSKEDNVICC